MPPDGFKIISARTAGFCMGVRRAVHMALDAADDAHFPLPIRTHGPLIHNPHVLQVLESRDIGQLGEDPAERVGCVVVRAHGVSIVEQEHLRGRSERLLDATCPHVRRLQELAREHGAEGWLCVLVGDRGHAEVEGVMSFCGGAGRVVAGPDEVAGLPDADKVVVLAQTTQDKRLFDATVEAVCARYGECLSFDTICRSTKLRQAEARDLAGKVDAMIVVGGFNSANTRRLANICAATGTPTYHVESDRQLDVDAILAYGRVGLTAGASTPNWMIRKVVRRLEEEHTRRTRPARYLAGKFLAGVVNTNVWAAGGAASLTFAGAQLLRAEVPGVGLCVAVAFFFVLSQQLLNQYGRRASLYLSEPDKADFFMANERTLMWLGIASAGLSLFLAALLRGRAPLALVAAGSVVGWLYRRRLPRAVGARIGFQSLEQLPGSKELFVGLAWACLAALVPALSVHWTLTVWRGAAVAFVVSFLMASQRTLALALGAVRADQIVGRETVAGRVGLRGAMRLFGALAAAQCILLAIAGGAMGWTTAFCYLLLAVVVCGYLAFRAVALNRWPGGYVSEMAVDAQFYLAGIFGLLWAAVGG